MAEPLLRALSRVRAEIVADGFVRAVASGRQRGAEAQWRRAELRYVDIKAGRRLQIVTFDQTQAFTSNHDLTVDRSALDDLLDVPFTNWRVESLTSVLELRVTKKHEAVVTLKPAAVAPQEADTAHDRAKPRLLSEQSPTLKALGLTDSQGNLKPSRQAKFRQVEDFLRLLDQAIGEAIKRGKLRRPTSAEPLRVVDLGCGNAYLTFAAHEHLNESGIATHVIGVDSKSQSLHHNSELAQILNADAEFIHSDIAGVSLEQPPDVVLALHACDTATDEAIARAIGWQAPLILAAPCCHHDIAAQLRRAPTPSPYGMLTRDGIVRERFADTLTDALRAQLLRIHGYRADVVEFVASQHTPRNTLLRAVRTGAAPRATDESDYLALVETWRVQPKLAELLA